MSFNFILRSVVVVCAAVILSGVSIAEVLTVKAKQSVVHWEGSKVLIDSKHNGTVQVKSGNVTLDKNTPQKATIVVDMTSIKDLDLKEEKWNKKLVGHLKSDDFFDVEKFPEAKLVANQFSKNKDGSYQVKGDLTIKGITKPVTFVAKVTEAKGKPSKVVADLEIDRTVWSVKYGSGKFFEGLGDKVISDTVKLKAEIHF